MSVAVENAFILHAMTSHGFTVADLNPSTPIALLASPRSPSARPHTGDLAKRSTAKEGVAPKAIFSGSETGTGEVDDHVVGEDSSARSGRSTGEKDMTIKIDNRVFYECVDVDPTVTGYESANGDWAFVARLVPETPAFVRPGVGRPSSRPFLRGDSDQEAVSEAIRIRRGN